MMKSCFLSTLLVANQFGATLAFSSRIGGARPTTVTPNRPIHAPMQSTRIDSSLFSSPRIDNGSSDSNIVQKRRAFLANFAAASLLPLIPFAKPASVSARGFAINDKGPLVYGADDIMSPKEHGTTSQPVQENLRYSVSRKLADKICSFNRVFAEMGGYFEGSTTFEKDVRSIFASTGEPVTFYDSVSGSPLFKAPVNRSVDDFISESKVHGWPSFRDEEVVWESVRVLKSSGETVSVDGTHLGHNLPDQNGNRYCINLVSIAGNPTSV
ncbi:hypothetical protein ACHAXR_006817 [Thalassiosira sp. AJA248-18]